MPNTPHHADQPGPQYITDFVARNAAINPHKPVILCNDRTLNALELWQLVQAAAERLAPRLPHDRQEVIAILLPNSWQFVVAYLATVHAGHIALPLDTKYKKLEIDSIVKQLQPALTITNAAFEDLCSPGYLLDTDIILPEHAATPNLPESRGTVDWLRLPPAEHVASLLFTSGTTGRPKAAPYTHASYIWNIQTAAKLWDWTAKDRLLLSLPLSHWHGLAMGLTGALVTGGSVRLQQRFEPEATLQALAKGDITMFTHVPLVYAALIRHKPSQQYDISGTRLCISASSSLPPRVFTEFKHRFGIEIMERYGTSEGGLIASNPVTAKTPGVVGMPVPGSEVQIRPDGAIAVRSPGVFAGYYKYGVTSGIPASGSPIKPDLEGWWLTGDIGEFTANGSLRIKGRVQEKIKRLGYTVYPRDVEWALLKNPAIREVFVLGLQDQNQLSDTIVYCIVGNITDDELQAYCKKNLHTSWRADRVIRLAALPRSHTGKTDSKALRQLATA